MGRRGAVPISVLSQLLRSTSSRLLVHRSERGAQELVNLFARIEYPRDIGLYKDKYAALSSTAEMLRKPVRASLGKVVLRPHVVRG